MAANTIPSTQIGVLSSKESISLKTDLPVYTPGPDEVLIQNVAVAANPKDWKMPFSFPRYANGAAVGGNDVAGYVVKVGEGVTEYKGGERVAAFTKVGTLDNKYGAYLQYAVAPVPSTFPIPDSVSFEDASTLPLAIITAALGLFKGLGVPESPFTNGERNGIIINGASSSVGAYAVQLAKRAGLFVIGIAGSSKDYAKSLGADVIVDYRERKGEALGQALIDAAAGHPIQYVYDAITENGSTLFLSRILSKISPDGKGKILYVDFPPEDELKQIPPGIKHEGTIAGSAHGDDEEFAARWYRQIGRWLAKSPDNPVPFKPNRVKFLPDGLASVERGLELLKTGQVHGEKLVYRIADTQQPK